MNNEWMEAGDEDPLPNVELAALQQAVWTWQAEQERFFDVLLKDFGLGFLPACEGFFQSIQASDANPTGAEAGFADPNVLAPVNPTLWTATRQAFDGHDDFVLQVQAWHPPTFR